MGDTTVHVWKGGGVKIYEHTRQWSVYNILVKMHTVYELTVYKVTLNCISLHSPHSVAGDLVH